jgi:hypothetical protein
MGRKRGLYFLKIYKVALATLQKPKKEYPFPISGRGREWG